MTFEVSIAILIIFWIAEIVAFCHLIDDGDTPAAIATVLFCVVTTVFCLFGPTREEMEESKYKGILMDKPSCISKPSEMETIKCLNKYKAWLKDSLDAVYKLDSMAAIRDSIKTEINLLKEKK